MRFSKRADVEPIWKDVQDRIIRNVSVGYRVHKYEQSEPQPGVPVTRLALDWEPYEISAVPIGADAAAQVRADAQHAQHAQIKTNPCVITTRAAKERTMDETREQP